jgi:hypothetical protein
MGLASTFASRLPLYQRSLDLLFLTDPRAGDARGLEDTAARFSGAQAVDAGMLHTTGEYIAWLNALKERETKRAQIRQGTSSGWTSRPA